MCPTLYTREPTARPRRRADLPRRSDCAGRIADLTQEATDPARALDPLSAQSAGPSGCTLWSPSADLLADAPGVVVRGTWPAYRLALTKAPAMPDEPILREQARAAIKNGKLPARAPSRTWGPGVDAPCQIWQDHYGVRDPVRGGGRRRARQVPCSPPVLRGLGIRARQAGQRLTAAPSSDGDLRRQIRARLAAGRLPLVDGVSRAQQDTGRHCLVCRVTIEWTDVEREVVGAGVFLHTYEACFTTWREESIAHRAATIAPPSLRR